jgi:DNA gyrase/topoisomerase IV subunit A
MTKDSKSTGWVKEVGLLPFAKKNYFEYAMATIEDRAFPDYADGMAPVHRRLLWAAHGLGLRHNGKPVKSARVVGETLGRFHPHGDCLDGDTEVYLLSGNFVKISSLVGRGPRKILAYDKSTNAYVHAFAHSWRVGQQASETYKIHLSDGSKVEATSNHQFLTAENGWLKTESLQVGTHLIGCGLKPEFGGLTRIPAPVVSVTKIEINRQTSAKPMYDFTVDGYENMLISTGLRSDGQRTLIVAHNSSCYEAMVKMTNTRSYTPMFKGEGNWGTLSEKGAAAMRYTEVRLSKFADEIVFNKFYTPVIEFVPNYDGSTKEPLVLPALLPLALLTGRFGMAPGITTNVPIFTRKSLIEALKIAFVSPAEPKALEKLLKIRSTYGGMEAPPVTKDEKEARKALFSTPQGRVVIKSGMSVNQDKATVVVETFARDTEIPKLLEALLSIKGVKSARDDSGKEDKYGKIFIQLEKSVSFAKQDAVVKAISKVLTASESYVLTFTERYVDKDGLGAAKAFAASVTDMINRWVVWRVALERKACEYWIKEDNREIRRLDLLIQAVNLIDFIVTLLKNAKLSTDEVYQAYAKKCKCTPEEAKYVLSRPIISLRKLDQKELEAKKKEVEANKATLEKRKKSPTSFLLSQLDGFAKL